MSIQKLQAIIELKKELGYPEMNFEQVKEAIGVRGILMDIELKAIFREHVRCATALVVDVDSLSDTIDFLERVESAMKLNVNEEELNTLDVLYEICESLDSLDDNADYASIIDDILNGYADLNIAYDLSDAITERLKESEEENEILTLVKCLKKLSVVK